LHYVAENLAYLPALLLYVNLASLVSLKSCIMFVVDTEKAIQGLNNRFFAGRRVQAKLYDMQLYERNDLSG